MCVIKKHGMCLIRNNENICSIPYSIKNSNIICDKNTEYNYYTRNVHSIYDYSQNKNIISYP